MPFNRFITTTIHGNRLGLVKPSSNATGGVVGQGIGGVEYAAGPDFLRHSGSSAASTGTDIRPWGYAYLPTSSAGSSQVYIVEPPIPGSPPLTITGSTAAEVYLKTKNSETLITSGGSSFTVINPSSLGFAITLVAITTAVWAVINGSTAAGHAYTTST